MKILKDTPFEVAWLVWKARPEKTCLTLVVKGSFAIVDSGRCPIDPQQELPAGDLHYDDDVNRSVRYESDFAHVKTRGECFVVGSCFAPKSKPVEMELAAFKIGPTLKKMAVIGDRCIQGLLKGQSKPVPFTEMPLCWERAFGGPRSKLNPVGEGLGKSIVNGKAVIRLPNIEDPANLIHGKRDKPTPIGSFPIPRTWSARTRHLGTYNSRWVDERWPWLPKDFNLAYHNAAPEDQRITGFYRGDEEIALINLHPEFPKIRCQLPGLRANAFLRDAKRDVLRPLTPELDTITVDTDLQKILCTWRAVTTVPSESLEEFSHLFVVHEEIGRKRSISDYRAWFEKLIADEEAGVREYEAQPVGTRDVRAGEVEQRPFPLPEEPSRGSERSNAALDPSSLLRRVGTLPEPVPMDSPVLSPVATRAFDEASVWIDIVFDESRELPEIPEQALAGQPPSGDEDAPSGSYAEPTITFDEHLRRKVAELQAGADRPVATSERPVAKMMTSKTRDDGAGLAQPKTTLLQAADEEPERPLEKTRIFSTNEDDTEIPLAKTALIPVVGPADDHDDASMEAERTDEKAGTSDNSRLLRSDWVSVVAEDDLDGGERGWAVTDESLMMLAEDAAFLFQNDDGHEPTAYMSHSDLASALARDVPSSEAAPSEGLEGSTTLQFIESFTAADDFDEVTEVQPELHLEPPSEPTRFESTPPPPFQKPEASEAKETLTRPSTQKKGLDEESALFIRPSELVHAFGGEEFADIKARAGSRPPPAPTEDEQRDVRERLMAAITADSDCAGWNLVDSDLSGLDLSGGKLKGALLVRANLSGASLDGADLQGALLDRARLTGASLHETDLSYASLVKAEGEGLRFDETCLDGADASEALFPDSIFRSCTCRGVHLDGADLVGARFEKTTLDQCGLSGAKLDGAVFVECSLVESELNEGTSAKGASLNDCQLDGLRASDGSDFSDATFMGAKIPNARFIGSRLERANFSFADLNGADFTEAILQHASFLGCKAREARFDRADLKRANLGKSDLHQARFEGAILQRTDMRGCNLFGAEFLDALLLDPKLELANLKGTKLAR